MTGTRSGTGRLAYDGGERSVEASDVGGAAVVIARHVHAQDPGRQKPGPWSRP